MFPEADHETVKMSWHFVLFCVIKLLFSQQLALGEFQIALLGCSCGCGQTPSQNGLEATAVLGPEDLKINIWAASFQVCPPKQVESFSQGRSTDLKSLFLPYPKLLEEYQILPKTDTRIWPGSLSESSLGDAAVRHGKPRSRASLIYRQSVSRE